MKIRVAILLALFTITTAITAQETLTLDLIYDPEKKISWSGTPQLGFAWIDEHRVAWPRTNKKGKVVQWSVFDTRTSKESPLFEPARLEEALKKSGVDATKAYDLAHAKSYTFAPDYSALVLRASGDLFRFEFAANELTQLTTAKGDEKEVSFSPDGTRLAFVRSNDLYTLDVRSGKEIRLTTDGSAKIYNGILDWVYQEEIYGRGTFRGYRWSPDSSRLLYLRLDDSRVPDFTIVDHIPLHQDVEAMSYPKAGDPNPLARLYVVPAAGGAAVAINHSSYGDTETLIVKFDWVPDSKRVFYAVQDREQKWLDLNFADATTGTPKTVVHQESPTWVNVDEEDRAVWTSSNTFLWPSDVRGYKHIHAWRDDGTHLRQVTRGDWDVRVIHGIDAAGWIYFHATAASPVGVDVYRVRGDGSRMQRLSKSDGTHVATFNGELSKFVDAFSDVSTPVRVAISDSTGKITGMLDENPVPELNQFRLSQPQFLKVPARDGVELEAMIIRPPNFDPSKKYPVYQHLYAGPNSPQVRNAWGKESFLFHQLLASKGIIVWICDNRSSSNKTMEATSTIYERLGESELRDIEDGLDWLAKQLGVDSSRIMLNGWSYGGFMVGYAMTRSKRFIAGISGGPVTDWRNYDSIYTERHMRTPANNEKGYDETSVLKKASDLHGRLLLIHGTTDDNVHMQNTIQLAYELQKAGKQFELMLYPLNRHTFSDEKLIHHQRQLMLGFIERNLLR